MLHMFKVLIMFHMFRVLSSPQRGEAQINKSAWRSSHECSYSHLHSTSGSEQDGEAQQLVILAFFTVKGMQYSTFKIQIIMFVII